MKKKLIVGNLSAETDWGYAPIYVEAFQYILNTNTASDYVVSTGESHTVAEFAKIAFKCFGLDSEKFVLEDPNVINRHLPRKIGDCSKLKDATGWNPRLTFPEMVQTLVKDYLLSIS